MANVTFGEPRFKKPEVAVTEIEKKESGDFDITFLLDKNEETIVPFGIKDFKNKEENQFFTFKYTLTKSNVDEFYFDIISDSGKLLYSHNCLKPAAVKNESKEKLFQSKKSSHIPMISAEEPVGSPHLEPKDYTAMGSYILTWDGFDSNDIYDSTRFNGKGLKATITAKKDGKQKNATVDFSTEYNEVQWTDVKINKNTKRIDVTLRVNLTDGGAKGLSCWNNTRNNGHPESPKEFCDWDKISQSDISRIGKPVIKTRTKSYTDLEKLALDGLKYHWGRNSEHAVAKDVKINEESYMVFINPLNTTENAMDSLDLVYNTNGDWMRSGNPGSATWNPVSWIGNIISGSRIAYNIGYLNNADWYEIFKSNWYFFEETKYKINDDFSYTSAHEIGHEILQTYGGTNYSYTHDHSSYITQSTIPIKKGGKSYIDEKNKGEINLMHYFEDQPWQGNSDFLSIAASTKDVLSLLWLTKIKIK